MPEGLAAGWGGLRLGGVGASHAPPAPPRVALHPLHILSPAEPSVAAVGAEHPAATGPAAAPHRRRRGTPQTCATRHPPAPRPARTRSAAVCCRGRAAWHGCGTTVPRTWHLHPGTCCTEPPNARDVPCGDALTAPAARWVPPSAAPCALHPPRHRPAPRPAPCAAPPCTTLLRGVGDARPAAAIAPHRPTRSPLLPCGTCWAASPHSSRAGMGGHYVFSPVLWRGNGHGDILCSWGVHGSPRSTPGVIQVVTAMGMS